MDSGVSSSILYICDGKKKCGGSWGCAWRGGEAKLCMRTSDPEHARYGACEGDPEWYPERFYKDERSEYFVEKEHF